MSRTLDVLANEQHGTVEGYRAGCRGANCPTGIELGLSCAKANMLAAGNWQYLKAVRRGLTPAEIAAELDLTPAARTEKKKKPARRDEPEGLEEEPVTEQPKTKKQGPSQSEVRTWAREQGLTVSNRGGIPRPIMDAYNARDKGVQASDVKPVEVVPEPVEVVDEVEKPTPLAEVTVTIPRPVVDWGLPLTSDDLRVIADALKKIERVPLDVVDLDEITVRRPGGVDVIGHFRLAADFEGDEAWLGFVPLGGAA